jgi:hypothetical protein
MKKPTVKLLVVSFLLVLSITLVIRAERQKKAKKPGNLTVEEIMKKRDEAADRALKTELANLVLQKNWKDFEARFNPERDGLLVSEIVRSIFIKTGMTDMTQADQGRLLQYLQMSAEALSGNKSPALLSILSQIERLPAPEDQDPSFAVLNRWISNHSGPELLRRTALIKLVYQETEPKKNHVQELRKVFFDQPLPGTTFFEWTARIEIMKSESTAVEIGKFLFDHQKSVPQDSLPSLLRALSSHPAKLTKETLALLRALMKDSSPQAIEACFTSIERLVKSNLVDQEERGAFEKYLFSLKDENLIRPLQVKRNELLELIGKP